MTAISPASRDRSRLLELAGLFLKLGTAAFGGPAAHIALMEDEVVRRRQWLTRNEFLPPAQLRCHIAADHDLLQAPAAGGDC